MNNLIRLPRYCTALLLVLAASLQGRGQGDDKALKAEADALFEQGAYAKAYPLFSQLVSLVPQDHDLNFKLGACTIYGDQDKAKAVGYLKFALTGPSTSGLAWYFLGKAYQLEYRFPEAVDAYKHFRGTGDKKLLSRFPVDALEQQCRNGMHLLSNLKDIQVMNKVEVEASDFFRFYDLGDIGGKIVVTPEELLSGMDRRSGERFLLYLPDRHGPIYFSSYGKDGKSGRDIYRTELLPTGAYATPVLLAGYINTPGDEDFPVMAADERTFFFCSTGHNSMGGYDVFKSAYDQGMDVFSAPENMDFAVNTPADELLYIIGPDGKEACFASNRDSKQNMVHVYRVSTTQTPINVTVLQGTFASNLDPADKRARIIVEDELTGERITEVNTDAQGNYTLVLPRGGKYRLLVDAGPEKRSYLAALDVPPSTAPQAFRQEMALVYKAGIAVELKNHFDQPLDGDLLALALEEVRRRARLDVTAPRPAVALAQPVPAENDPLQDAGFDGTVSMAQAVSMAEAETRLEQERGEQQQRLSKGAMDIALANLETSEQQAELAANLARQAHAQQPSPEQEQLFRRAAQAKLNSEDASQRAWAAYRTSTTMAAARTATLQRETQARTLQTALQRAVSANDAAATTAALKQLKSAVDARKGPDGRTDDAELMRRNATEAEAEAQAKLRRATSQREEQQLLADRVARLSSEAAHARGRKQQDLQRDLAGLQEQDQALREEVDEAFQEARETESAAALARGQVQLVRYLDAAKEQGLQSREQSIPEDLEQRLARVGESNAKLVIAQEFLPVVAASPAERDLRIFNWGIASALASGNNDPTATMAQASNGTLSQGRLQGRDQAPLTAQGQVAGGEYAADRDGAGGTTSADSRTTDQPSATTANTGQAELQVPIPAPAARSTVTQSAEGDRTAEVMPVEIAVSDSATQQHAGVDVADDALPGGRLEVQAPVGAATVAGQQGEELVAYQATDTGTTVAGTATTVVGNAQAELPVTLSDSAMPDPGLKQEGGRTDTATAQAMDPAAVPVADPSGQQQRPAVPTGTQSSRIPEAPADEQAFMLRNGLAELEQLRKAEKDHERRDSLDQAIIAQKARIHAAQTNSTSGLDPALGTQVDRYSYVLLDFDVSILDQELINEVIPDFGLLRDAIYGGPGTDQEKAARLHALEMRLIDSIEVQMQGTVATLEQHPEQANDLLPRLERWRRLKAARVEAANRVLAAAHQQYEPSETIALEDAQMERSGLPLPEPETAPATAATTPHNDNYVKPEPEMARIYHSPLTARAPKVEGAVARLAQDMDLADNLRLEIDSMRREQAQLVEGKAFDQLVERTDRKLDDLLIHIVDAGQRSIFITRNEFELAKDSAKVLSKRVQALGLPQNAPLEQMARTYEAEAQTAMNHASAMRKRADNGNDILTRDSLYRAAYAEELQALRTMDRSLTVRNYLLAHGHGADATLTYAEVEQRLFPEDTSAIALDRGDASNTVAHGENEQLANLTPMVADTAVDPGAMIDRAPVRPIDVQHDLSAAGQVQTDSSTLAGYLQRYYYLDPPETDQILAGPDESRYFLMKGRSMEQRADAVGARLEADGALELAQSLQSEADAARSGQTALDRVRNLDLRVASLRQRADSLQQAALRAQTAADRIDAQAAAWMQGLPPDRSAAIMGLEQTRRRTEPVLARSRPQSNTAEAAAPAAGVQPATGSAAQPPATALVTAIVPGDTARRSEAVVAPVTAASSGRSEAPASAVPPAGAAASTVATAAGPLEKDMFEVGADVGPRQGPIPMDIPLPTGVVYKVQVGAFRQPLPAEAFSDVAPLAGEHLADGVVRYSAGLFTTAASAADAGAKLRQRGYRDAFVVAYQDGKRVPLREAMLAASQAALRQAPLAHSVGGSGRSAEPQAQALPPAPVATRPANLSGQGATAAAESAVLAAYPQTAQAVLEAFAPTPDAAAYYTDPEAAPAKQVETVKGLFFTVQVGVYSKPTPLDRLFNITPLNSELTANAKIRYTTGMFLEEQQAALRKNATVALGVSDAFVTAYLNGKRIPLRDARVLLAKFGKAILADPADQGK